MCNQKLFSAPVLQAEQTMLHPPLCKCVYRPYTSLPVLIHVLSAFNFIWEIGSTPKLPSYPGSSPTLIPRFLLYKRLLPYPRTQAPPLPSYPGSSCTGGAWVRGYPKSYGVMVLRACHWNILVLEKLVRDQNFELCHETIFGLFTHTLFQPMLV